MLATVLVATFMTLLPGWQTPAAAAAGITVAAEVPGQTLIGRETPVELTFGNPEADTAYNLAFFIRLPLGVSISSSDYSPSSTITETNAAGEPVGTVVAWENLVDIVAGGRYRFHLSLQHDAGTAANQWTVGETIDAQIEAFVNRSPGVRPQIEATPDDPVTAQARDFTASASESASTTLVPLLLTKSEPSPEGELLRGVHDHQTVFTLEAETGSDPSGVAVGRVEDWIPAGLEFLGCGTEDNSTAEEYPGSGPLNPGNAPALADPCPEPVLVETVDSGLPAGLPAGVYTHVVWQLDTTIPADTIVAISYVAGIPQRANTTSWPNGTPTPESGDQGSNIDNNTGPFTTQVDEGTTFTNRAQVGTTFGGIDTTVEDTESVQAVDLRLIKSVDSTQINQGAISTWQLRLDTSEYVVDGGVANLALTDITPDGTCAIGSPNERCTVSQPGPVPDYTQATWNQPGPGQTTLQWDLSGETLGRSQTFVASFSTETLPTYSDGEPVSAQDSWTNTASLEADVTTFGPGGPDDTDGFDTNPVEDDSSQEQSGSAVSFRKDVGLSTPGMTCGNGSAVEWNPDVVAGAGPGDRVCYRLAGDSPATLDTLEATITDFLPPGMRYEVDSATPGINNDVPTVNVLPPEISGDPATGQRLDWTLRGAATIAPRQTVEVVFSAILDGGLTPDLIESGDIALNEARLEYLNTSGEIFVVADDAGAELSEAHLNLTKGIASIDPPTAAPTAFDPPVDTVTDVTGGTVVTYALDVVNDGTRDAIDIEVRDLLADNDQSIAGQDAVCAAIGAISDDGSCSGDDVVWTGLTVPAGEKLRLTYTWTMPNPVPIAASWTNRAGVVEYHSTTNTDVDFEYVPRDNIDPSREPDANTDPADDDAHVFSPGISMTKSRTTEITEPGNSGPDQATIGEVIHYTVLTRQSANTQASDYLLSDDLAGSGLQLLPDTVEASSGFVAPGEACSFSGDPILPSPDGPLTVTGERIEFGVATLDVQDRDGCLEIRFDARVADAPEGGEALNVRPGSVRNVATLTYEIETGTGTVPGSVSSQVDTALVEPNIDVDKRTSEAGRVLPGAVVPYEVVVTNVAGGQVSTAHGVVVTDDFSDASVAEVVDNPDGGVVSGDTITWTLPEDPDGDGEPGLAPGGTVTLRYTVRLDDDLEAGVELTNTAEVVTSSLAGSSPFERTDESDCSPADCPGYVDEDSATIVVGGPSITKTVATRLHTIGDEVEYVVRAFFPAHLDFGSDVVTISDNLSRGATTYLRTVSAVCTGCTDDERAQFEPPEDNGTAGRASPRWDLAVFDAGDTARQVVITFRVRVEDAASLEAGDSLTNTATLRYEEGTLTSRATIDIAEPDVSLVKRVGSSVETTPRETEADDPVPAEVGGTVNYELAVTNDGDWTAYDVDVTDEPDSVSSGGDCTGDARLVATEVAAGTGWQVTDGTLGTGDACLGFRVPTLLPGQTVVIRYTLTIPEDFPRSDLIAGNEFVNTADVPRYFGLDDGDRGSGAGANPDVRDYPADPVTDTGYVDVAGGALGDLVWLDLDGDGLGPDTGDPTEPGIPDVTVTITGPGGTLTRTTDASGRWLTDDGSVPPDWLAAGTYTITIDTATLPGGLTNSADPDGGNDSTAATTLAENEVDLTQDFGYTGAQSVGDTVWLDLDGDGTQDAGEPGIPDVALRVTWAGLDGDLGTADDIVLATPTTDGSGEYLVPRVPAGPVRVVVDTSTLPAGLTPTFDLDGGADSTADRAVEAGEDALDVDFGYTGTAIVGDLVWEDLDGDGLGPDSGDPDEPGLPAVDVVVTWAGFDGELGTDDDVAITDRTDADGRYLVSRLPAGQVRVAVDTDTLPGGLAQTFDPDGVLDDQTVRTLATGSVDRDADFGYRGLHTIGDLVWLDVDADGLGPDTGDTDEPGVPGQPVTVVWAGVDGELGTADDVELPGDTTDASGRWSVVNVPDGLVRVTLAGGPAATLRVTADPDGTLDGVTEREIDDDVLDFDFGLTGTGSVGDLVWFDVDGDGQLDAGEPPIPGVDLQVTWAGSDGELGTADDVDYGTATTGTDGTYRVGNLPAGPVRVTVDASTVPPGMAPTFDLDGGLDQTAVRVLGQGEDASDVDFGYRGQGTAGDRIWWDLDSDAVQDDGEPGLPGVLVGLDWEGFDGEFGTDDDQAFSARTDADGGYLFTGLPAGDFVVRVDADSLPAGMTQTADPDDTLDHESAFALGVAESNLDLDFGYAGDLSVGDLVWSDVNRDEERQPAEPALDGVGITVLFLGADGAEGGGDDVTITTATAVPAAPPAAAGARVQASFVGGVPGDGDPLYTVGGLVPGAYRVTLDPATLPAETTPLADRDAGDPAVTSLTLDASVDDVDFAVFRNDAPTSEVVTAVATCGDTITVDPTEGVSDVNGDTLTLVPDSVVAPDDVTVTVTDSGDLRITTLRDDDYTVTWEVSDGRGATTTVTLEVTVTDECTSGDLPDTGSSIPPWLPLLALGLLLAGAGMVLAARQRR